MSEERDDLEALLTHPGYLRLKAWAESEWRDQAETHTEQAANEVDDLKALQKLRQVIAAKRAVRLVFDWAPSRLSRLAVTTTPVPVSQSRRGGL